jgi:hypothetical protein
MTGAEIASQAVTVVHSTLLLEEPRFGAPPLALLSGGDRMISNGYVEGFLHVRRGEDLVGHVPAAICAPQAIEAPAGIHPTTHVLQTVALYSYPVPGRQFTSDRSGASTHLLIFPDEPLLILGRDGLFVLENNYHASRITLRVAKG